MNEEELRKQLKQEIKQELKKERRKKRIIILVVLTIIILGYVGYIYINKENNKGIPEAEFKQYKEIITISKDNWKDYIITEDITKDLKDSFGQLIRTNKNTGFKLKENICGYVIIEIKEKSKTGTQTLIIKGGDIDLPEIDTYYPLKHNQEKEIYDNTTTIDNIECIQIKGYIYKLNIPDNLWKINKNTGNHYIKIELGENSWYTITQEENYIYDLSSNEYFNFMREKD